MIDFNKISEDRQIMKDSLISSKYDLDDLIDKLFLYRQQFFEKIENNTQLNNYDHPNLDIVIIVNSILPSYLAPAYHYNSYIDTLIIDLFWDDEKFALAENDLMSSALRRASYQIDVQALLLSVKMALDRLVLIFSYYYSGISVSTTFGRYKENGKPQGLMSKVHELNTTDSLMSYINTSYHEWIKFAVSPRDTITHYNDLGITYLFDSTTMTEIPIHTDGRFIGGNPDDSDKNSFKVDNIKEISERWYKFFERIISDLQKKEIIITKPRL